MKEGTANASALEPLEENLMAERNFLNVEAPCLSLGQISCVDRKQSLRFDTARGKVLTAHNKSGE